MKIILMLACMHSINILHPVFSHAIKETLKGLAHTIDPWNPTHMHRIFEELRLHIIPAREGARVEYYRTLVITFLQRSPGLGEFISRLDNNPEQYDSIEKIERYLLR